MGGLVNAVGSLFGGGQSNNAGFTAKGAGQDTLDLSTKLTESGLTQQQQLASALAGQGGINGQSSVFNQLQNVASGTGPNPAQAMLAQQTGANTANQAALMAGQRGAGANPAMIARLAAQQGAANQQNAVGQGATMQANQSLNALNQMGGIAGQQVQQQMQSIRDLNSAAQGYQGNVLNSMSNQNNANAQMAQTNANNSSRTGGGLLNAAGSILTGGLLNKGGEVEAHVMDIPEHLHHMAQIYHPDMLKMALGGPVQYEAGSASAASNQSKVEFGKDKIETKKKEKAPVSMKSEPVKTEKKTDTAGGVKEAVDAGSMLAAHGGSVPGKAKVKGDSPKNDIVPAMLSPGEVVIPKSVMESEDPISGASEFVAELVKKHGYGNEHEDFKSALKKAISSRGKK